MTHEERLEGLIKEHGTFENIVWGTMYGDMKTFGSMTDNHVENSRLHHYGMTHVLMGQLGYLKGDGYTGSDVIRDMSIASVETDIENCKFNEYLMKEIQRRRGTTDA